MAHIPTPEELFGEPSITAPETTEFEELLTFLGETLGKHVDVLKTGRVLRVMVSCETTPEDVAVACRLFRHQGWQASYLSCPPRPHQLFFSRPNVVGGPNSSGYPSIH
ncbi:MAG: hypothetical protein KC777_06750 [Cyanobacteria bacterium HKST-UBA02]|nr:hypothetical protein [Cyanobacteria bacterium HKST-UBA02]